MLAPSASFTVSTPTDREIRVSREFNAPARLVWAAMTTPELIKRWLFSPPGWEMTRCDGDYKVGGKFRWEWNGPDGKLALVIHGSFKEVVPHQKIVHTERMEMPGGMPCSSGQPATQPADTTTPEMTCTTQFTERAGRTTMVMTMLFPSKEIRDAALASGMEHGMAAGYDNLDQMLASQK
jgi:uncharacterized protein YndB with AHSA1/START domain